jgi:branched-subunit amino acid aminotransferase/4-amino-4-deoxychorismate lyase
MTTKVYLSTVGAPVDPEDAKVSVFDRGFLYGDSVYETMRTAAGGKPVELARHLERLRRSGSGIGLTIPFSAEHLADVIARTHAAAGNDESYVRLIVTRGRGPIMLDPRQSGDPTLVVLVQPLELPARAMYERGLAVVIVAVDKAGGGLVDPEIKTGNYLNNIIALRRAIERGGEDAILCTSAGEVAEGATSNVFMVAGNELRTPDLRTGLLPGITRQVVCELAAEIGHPARESVVHPDELRAADEVFLTSSVRGIMPVTRLDGALVGAGTVGPITRLLSERYAQYIETYES